MTRGPWAWAGASGQSAERVTHALPVSCRGAPSPAPVPTDPASFSANWRGVCSVIGGLQPGLHPNPGERHRPIEIAAAGVAVEPPAADVVDRVAVDAGESAVWAAAAGVASEPATVGLLSHRWPR